MKSKDMRQLVLPSIKAGEGGATGPREYDLIPLLPHVRTLPTLHSAIEFARGLAGLQDKQIYGPLGIDSGAFSRMKAGEAWYPQDHRWLQILDVMRTQLPVAWQVEALGYDWSSLRRHTTEVEDKLEKAEARIRQMEHDHEIERRAWRDIAKG